MSTVEPPISNGNGVFNEESLCVFKQIRQLASALTDAAASSSAPAGLAADCSAFVLTRSLSEVTTAVREAGKKLSFLLDTFEQNVTNQFVEFYRAMNHKVESEHHLLRSTKSLMPSDPSLLKHLVAASHEELQVSLAAFQPPTPRNGNAVSNVYTSSTHRNGGQLNGSLLSAAPSVAVARSPRRVTSPSHALPPLDAIPVPLPSAAVGSGTFVASPSKGDASSPHESTKASLLTAPQNGAGLSSVPPPTNTAIASEHLRVWLYLTLQSAMQLCEASRGAIFLKSSGATAYLRRICGINAEDKLPLDVSPAAGSTIATVVQNSVGINIGRSRQSNPHALDNYSRATQAVRSSIAIQIQNGVIFPIGDFGCVLIADKLTESFFSELDEHVVWSTAMMIRGVLRRYSLDLLSGKPIQGAITALSSVASLPPIAVPQPAGSITTQQVTPHSSHGNHGVDKQRYLSPEEELQNLLPGITRIPRLPKKLVVIRASEYQGFQQILARDMESLRKIELSDEDLLEAAVPYLSNLEALWKKSIDSMTELRSTIERMERELANRNARIIELEVEHRVLSRQYAAMRSDVQKIRAAVPQHLRDIAGVPGDLPIANTNANLLRAISSQDRVSRLQKRSSNASTINPNHVASDGPPSMNSGPNSRMASPSTSSAAIIVPQPPPTTLQRYASERREPSTAR